MSAAWTPAAIQLCQPIKIKKSPHCTNGFGWQTDPDKSTENHKQKNDDIDQVLLPTQNPAHSDQITHFLTPNPQKALNALKVVTPIRATTEALLSGEPSSQNPHSPPQLMFHLPSFISMHITLNQLPSIIISKPYSTTMMQSEQKQNYENYRIHCTLLELLQARGYMIPEDKQNLSFDQFCERRKDFEEGMFYKDVEEGEPIVMAVKCNFNKRKIDSPMIESFMKDVGNVKTNHFFFIAATNAKGTMEVDKSAESIQKMRDQIRIEFFPDQNLKFNVLKHDLVPEHIVLSEKQKDELLDYYKVKISQLPKMLHNDPVAKFLGLRKNQVVKIIRRSETAAVYTFYRAVI